MVHRVRDERTGAVLALKVMSLELLGAAEYAERFQREAKIGATIRSDHVVRVHDSGIDEATAFPYFTMDLLEGEDLHRRLEREPMLDRSFSHELLRQLFDALRAAHAVKIVHRDLKPENLFLVSRAEGAPTLKVLDFGVAKIVREITGARTRAGLGSPLWVAPEQGREGQLIRPSSDVWALGLVTYRLLAGTIYWRAANAPGASAFDLAVEMLRAPIAPPSLRSRELGVPELGADFDAWFLRAVDRDPSRRFADAGEAWRALGPLLEAMVSAGAEVPHSAKPGEARRSALGWLRRLLGG